MHFTTAFTILAAAGLSTAAPAPSSNSNLVARADTWTIENFQRQCNQPDTECNVKFAINTNDGSAATPCNYNVTGTPASTASYANVACGSFVLGSTHSTAGFTVLSAHNTNQIVYPGYSDTDLQSGNVVKPDRSFTVQPYNG